MKLTNIIQEAKKEIERAILMKLKEAFGDGGPLAGRLRNN